MNNIIDYIALGLSILSILWTFFWISLKPKLEIESVEIKTDNDKSRIRVNVINKCCCFDAINVKMEICVYSREKDSTRHLEVDKDDFLMIPCKDERIFKSKDLSKELEEKIKAEIVRVRVYAAHSFSGFGKVFEGKFRYHKPLQFIRI